MIAGMVNALREAIIPLSIQNSSGQAHLTEAVVDSGFNGYLTLPPALIASCGLSWLYQQQGFLADGTVHTFDVYQATILWDGQPRTVETEALDVKPLVGMAMLEGHKLEMEVRNGGGVTIQTLP